MLKIIIFVRLVSHFFKPSILLQQHIYQFSRTAHFSRAKLLQVLGLGQVGWLKGSYLRWIGVVDCIRLDLVGVERLLSLASGDGALVVGLVLQADVDGVVEAVDEVLLASG